MVRIASLLITVLALVAVFLYYPSMAGTAALVVFFLGVSLSVLSILRRQFKQYHSGQIDRAALIVNNLAEMTGMLITLGLSILLGRLAMVSVIGQVSGMWGFVLGMLAAVGIG